MAGSPTGLPAAEADLARFLGHGWAAMAAEVVDAKGRTLVCCGGGGDGGFTSGEYMVAMPGAEPPADPAIAWPVTLTLRVPREYAVERVRFEVHDLDLPPRPEPLPRAVPVIETVDAGARDPRDVPRDASWSEWSKPERGLSARFSFQKRTPRGERLASGLALRIHPAGLPEGVTCFDPFGLERGVRLVLTSPERGTAVEIPAVDPMEGPPSPPRTGEEERGTKPVPLGPGASTEFQLWFPLASAWETLLPGTWQARLAVEVTDHPEDPPPHAEGTPVPVPWTGTFTTEPVRVVVEDAPLRTVKVMVPRRLRVVPWAGAGAGVAVGCLEEDREPAEFRLRNGFLVGVRVRRTDGGVGEAEASGGAAPRLDTVDQLEHGREGPYAAGFSLEIFETGEEFRCHQEYSPRHPTFRTLWKREFRVEATAEEIEALQR